MPERKDYYNIPENFRLQRVNLKEKPGQALRIEQPSGELTITFFGRDKKFPYAVTSLPSERTLALITDGEGIVLRGGEQFEIDHAPAVFLVDHQNPLQLKGSFNGWIVHLKETLPTEGLPTTNTSITEKVFTRSEIEGEIKDPRFPNARGEFVRWIIGQWNSESPINVAYEGGGLGSIGDAGIFDLEDQIAEIQLSAQGRLIHTTIVGDFQSGNDNPRVTDSFKCPARAGDVTIAKPGSLISMSRYSGDYSGFTLKWAVDPGVIIDPSLKREIKL